MSQNTGMTRWQHLLAAFEIRNWKFEIVFQRPDAMTDEQLTTALRSLPDGNSFYKAIMQLLEEMRDEAIESEAADAWSPTAMAKHSGGAEYIKAVRDDILRRRHQGKTPTV